MLPIKQLRNLICALVATTLIGVLSIMATIEEMRAAEPIKIGFSMALTGAVSPNGRQILLALQIWRDDVNAKGGLLGRPVELVYYDDQSSPANVPGIYSKLTDVDKVDLLIGPYASNMIAAAMPTIMRKNMIRSDDGARGQPAIQISKIFLHAADRDRRERSGSQRDFSNWLWRKRSGRRPWRSSPPMLNLLVPRPMARARTPRLLA